MQSLALLAPSKCMSCNNNTMPACHHAGSASKHHTQCYRHETKPLAFQTTTAAHIAYAFKQPWRTSYQLLPYEHVQLQHQEHPLPRLWEWQEGRPMQ